MASIIGSQYPIVKTERGLMAPKKGVDIIKADLLQLLRTNPGERVMMPTYGTSLRSFVFEPNDSVTASRVREVIAKAINEWEPRIVVQNVIVSNNISFADLNQNDTHEEQPQILSVKIEFFDPNDISQVESLELQLPLGDEA